jgi:hypothetical protein
MEQMGELRKSEERTRLMYRVVVWISGLTIIAVLVYGLASALVGPQTGVEVVGSSLVSINIPFAWFAKPISYLSVASVVFVYSGFRLWQNKIARWSHFRLSFIQLFAVVVAFASVYEILYNFMLWGAFLSTQLLTSSISPSVLINVVSSPAPVPWNLVFATKIFLSLFAISGYTVYFLRRIRQANGFRDEF